MKIIFATRNQGKVEEMRAILAGLPVEVLSVEEMGVEGEAREDADTFAQNALQKARYVTQQTRQWAMADDSGLCINVLDGAPGILTARWAGDRNLVEYTLDKMRDVTEENRVAHFESAVALVSPEGKEWVFTGRVAGSLAIKPRGTAHPKLPYDVLFIPDGHDKTFAEMSAEQKNSISHRGLAFQKLRSFLREIIEK